MRDFLQKFLLESVLFVGLFVFKLFHISKHEKIQDI